MTPAQLRGIFTANHLSAGDVARILKHFGDQSELPTIRRRVNRWLDENTREIPGEAAAFVNLFTRVRWLLSELTAVLPEAKL